LTNGCSWGGDGEFLQTDFGNNVAGGSFENTLGKKGILMTTPQLDPARFHHLAAEYRTLAKTRPIQKEKAELLDLAARLTALAELDLWKPSQRKAVQPPRSSRRVFKFASEPMG
jgi:hypothetical protein